MHISKESLRVQYASCLMLVGWWRAGGGGVGGGGGFAAKQFGTNSAWQHLRPLQWAGITFQKAPPSPRGAAATGWTLFVFPPHAAGFRGGEGQRWERGRDESENEASSPRSIFCLFLSVSPLRGFGLRLRKTAARLIIFVIIIIFCLPIFSFFWITWLPNQSPYFPSRVLRCSQDRRSMVCLEQCSPSSVK